MQPLEALEGRVLLHAGEEHGVTASTVTASVDSYVRAGADASKNFGNTAYLEVKKHTDLNYLRVGYLKFDLAGLSSVTSAKLRIYGGSSGDALSVGAFRTSSGWSENTINYNNRPATTGSALGTVSVGKTKAWFEINITAAVKEALAAKQTSVSVALTGTNVSTPNATFNSSEASSNRPQLVIDGSGGTTNPPPSTPVPTKAITWTSKAQNPLAREETVAFDYGGWLYSIGGYYNDDYDATTRVDRYNPSTNTWQTRKNAPTKITHAGTAVDTQKGIVWMVGGFIGDFPNPQGTNKVWKYNPNSDSWSQGPTLPASRAAGGAAIVGRTLYYFGGSNATRNADKVEGWKLNLDDPNAKWQSIASMPSARNHFGYAAVNGKIYVIGGQRALEDDSTSLSSVLVYSPSSNSWSYTASLPEVISHFHASTDVYKNRYIITAGGENPHNVAQSDVFLFDTQTSKWTRLSSLPNPRRAPAGAIIGDKFVLSGGWNANEHRRNTYVADLLSLNLA